jgi:lysyl-tRNA synthetase class 2
LHNPEFTLVEWYRVGDAMEAGMQLLAELACELLDVSAVERLSYGDAFQTYAGIDPHTASVSQLQRAAESLGISPSCAMSDGDRDEWLNRLLSECVAPRLGELRPLILFDYPASQAALARVRPGHPPLAERFELYVRGIELANGYHELLDAAVLAERNRLANDQRLADGKYALPEESRLLGAMRHGLPPCTGVALGFDRLVMVVAGASRLEDVIAFPIDRA